uniref:Acyl carrier protein n=1 Tax=Streptomyces viridochromogenes TaxID=1938 RepID=G0WV79_STRVR|nr:acyl carrier protein [Streptomyces viridochromogenes]
MSLPDPGIETHTVEGLRAWLTDCVATHLDRPADTIDTSVRLTDYGLDSLYVLAVAAELEDHLDISLDPTLMWDNPTIDALSEALVAELAQTHA